MAFNPSTDSGRFLEINFTDHLNDEEWNSSWNWNTSNKVTVKCPSSYKWSEEDLSASNAGRNADYQMLKMTKARLVKLDVVWNNPTIADAATILTQFRHEYFWVRYLDANDGDYKIMKAYVGNRTSPLYNAAVGRWSSISFSIIQKNAEKVGGA